MITDTNKKARLDPELGCREARKRIRAQQSLPTPEANSDQPDSRLDAHLLFCPKCAAEARVTRLYRFILAGDAPLGTTLEPDADWFKGLRARIERETSPKSPASEDSFAGIVWLAARQMVPAMVVLVLLIAGATLFWSSRPDLRGSTDPVLMNQVVEYPQPTSDDVLGTLLAVEDKKNAK